MNRRTAVLSTALLAFVASAPPAQRTIRTVRRPAPQPVTTENVRVTARIVDGVATTRIEQTLRNPGRRAAEADWVLPLPHGAIADHFTITMNGEVVASEILDAPKARKIYEDIVRRRRDPGLLEYYGQGCLRARVFPVPPSGTVDVVVQYRQVVPANANLREWAFPLRAVTGLTGAKLSLDVRVESRQPLKTAYSPLPSIDVVRSGDHEIRASLELPAGSIPDRDLQLFYSTHESAFGLDLLTHRLGDDGYMLAMISPKHEWPEPKNVMRVVQFVIDTSGSMKGKKIKQAQSALRFFVQSLRSTDRFNIIPFSTEARPFFAGPVGADEDNLKKALEKIAAIQAVGGTNIEEAMTSAMLADLPKFDTTRTVVPITVFLTDGQPTIGLTDPDQLTKKIATANSDKERIFVFGVGNDVNTRLLDNIAEDSRGDRDYVREDENIEVKTSALFTKLSHPVMTNLALSIDGVEIADRAPKHLPDLFKGSHLLVLARYRGKGQRAIRLRGTVDGVRQELVFEGNFDGRQSHDFVPGLWAERRVAVLLEAIRLNGKSKELTDEVRRLGKQFGIVTPYTSHLIVEEGQRVANARGLRRREGRHIASAGEADRVADELRKKGAGVSLDSGRLGRRLEQVDREATEAERALDDIAVAPSTGATAVRRSVRLKAMKDRAGVRGFAGDDSAVGLTSQRLGSRTFHLVGGAWVDQAFTEAMRGKERRIPAFSDEYFALLRANPDLATCFAFSARLVVVLAGGQAVEITG